MYVLGLLLILLLLLSISYKESFTACSGTDCTSCSKQSGCAWCDQTSTCMDITTLKSTDTQCNQMNAISSSFLCPSVMGAALQNPNSPPDNELYQDQIADRVRPPNVGLIDQMEYSPETVMGNLNEVQQNLTSYQRDLPGIISSSVENSIQPMVKGLLSSTYHRQCDE